MYEHKLDCMLELHKGRKVVVLMLRDANSCLSRDNCCTSPV